MQSDRKTVETSRAQYQDLWKQLRQVQETIAEDEAALRDLDEERAIKKSLVRVKNRSADALKRNITAEVEKCSGDELKPLLRNLYERLPIELREQVYRYLMPGDNPYMVPQAEKWQTDGQHPTETGLDPFRGNYVFNTRVMGYDVSYETRAYFLRTTPLSFRGSRSKGDLDKLLSIAVWPGKDVRDFIRHLRLILHCGSFDEDLQIMALNILPDSLSIEEKTSIAESRVYDTYHSYLANISSLPFDKHTIKLEICILHGFISHPSLVEEYQRIERYKYNIFEALKPIYFQAKSAGADISVRYEGIHHGEHGQDISWELDLDADAWAERNTSIYTLRNQDEPPSRRAWLDSVSAAAHAHPHPPDTLNPNWRDSLYAPVRREKTSPMPSVQIGNSSPGRHIAAGYHSGIVENGMDPSDPCFGEFFEGPSDFDSDMYLHPNEGFGVPFSWLGFD